MFAPLPYIGALLGPDRAHALGSSVCIQVLSNTCASSIQKIGNECCNGRLISAVRIPVLSVSMVGVLIHRGQRTYRD